MVTEESRSDSREIYNEKWYKNRAFNSITKIDEDAWDFSDSLLLFYSDESGTDYKVIQQTDSPYNQLVTRPERIFLESVADRIASKLPNSFDYIDLGPGTEHKEQFLFDALKKQGKHFTYIPVDISKKFLDLAAKHAIEQGINTSPLQAPFEEVAAKLGTSDRPRFVSLGLTYTNYHPADVLALLSRILGKNGIAFVDVQIRDRAEIDKITSIYEQDVASIAKPKIKLLGLDPISDISGYTCDSGVRLWGRLRNSTPELESRGIGPGVKLLVFQSLRPTLESFQQDVTARFLDHEILDEGGPFVGALLIQKP